VGIHDELFEEPTVRIAEVPPEPKPVESLTTATNLDDAGNGKINAASFPVVTIFSKMTLVSSP